MTTDNYKYLSKIVADTRISDIIDKTIEKGKYFNLLEVDEYRQKIKEVNNEIENKLADYISRFEELRLFLSKVKDRYELDDVKVNTGIDNIYIVLDSYNILYFGFGDKYDVEEKKQRIIIDHKGEFCIEGFKEFTHWTFEKFIKLLLDDNIYDIILRSVNDVCRYNVSKEDCGIYPEYLEEANECLSSVDGFVARMSKK